MKSKLLICLSFLLVFSLSAAFGQSQLSYRELVSEAEMNPRQVVQAKKLAMQKGLPLSIYFPEGILIDVLGIEDGQPVYSLIDNPAHPEKGGQVIFYHQIERQFDLSAARIYYGNGTWQNKYIGAPVGSGIRRITSDSLILIPESSNDRVMALDASTGDVVDLDFIPSTANLSTPIQARLSPWETLTVSDQIKDVVQEFDTSGSYLGFLAPAGGPNNAILDNVRGHNYKPDGKLVVTSASGSNSDAIAEFDSVGNYLGNFIEPNSNIMASPWGIIFRTNDVLVTGGSTDAVHRYDLTGTYLDNFASNLNFPEQVNKLSGGNIGVGVFSSPSGVYIFSPTGTLLNTLTGVSSNRGVFELGSGNILTTNSGGVHELDPNSGALIRTIVSGVSARFITLMVTPSVGPLNPPQNLTATSGNHLVDLTWDAPATKSGTRLQNKALLEYYIYRSEDNLNFNVIDTSDTSETFYLDTTAVNDVTYWYYVTAEYDQGESLPSDTVQANPSGPDGKILISEIVVTPTEGEFIEIYNPNSNPVDLTDFYLTDATYANGDVYYYKIVEGGGGGGGFFDFHARFPDGALIQSNEYQTVALAGDSLFFDVYGVLPTYELFEDSTNFTSDVPDMREATAGSINNQGGLTNGDEVVILYYWDGLSDLVLDSDYLLYNQNSPTPNDEAVDKTGVEMDGPDANPDSSHYVSDTPVASQISATSHPFGQSLHRTDYSEGSQTTTGGNGITGADETSEDLNNTFTNLSLPSPNEPLIPVGIDHRNSGTPDNFALLQNYPNPFNPWTSIRYALKSDVDVTLAIFNVLGQQIRLLVNERQTAGYKTVRWNGRDENGQQVSSGIYIYRIEAGSYSAERKLLLIR